MPNTLDKDNKLSHGSEFIDYTPYSQGILGNADEENKILLNMIRNLYSNISTDCMCVCVRGSLRI